MDNLITEILIYGMSSDIIIFFVSISSIIFFLFVWNFLIKPLKNDVKTISVRLNDFFSNDKYEKITTQLSNINDDINIIKNNQEHYTTLLNDLEYIKTFIKTNEEIINIIKGDSEIANYIKTCLTDNKEKFNKIEEILNNINTGLKDLTKEGCDSTKSTDKSLDINYELLKKIDDTIKETLIYLKTACQTENRTEKAINAIIEGLNNQTRSRLDDYKK